MGTRAIIAKPEGDGWAGKYHHWDGYPSGLGVTLVTGLDVFGGDLDAMIRKLVDDEMVGWSTINGRDLTAPPEWDGKGIGPESYTARGETPRSPEGDWLRSTDPDSPGCGWCYVLTPRGVMVLEGDYGAFGYGGGNFRSPVLVPWGDVAAMEALEGREED